MNPAFTQNTNALLSIRLIGAKVVERKSTHGLPAGDIESLTRRLATGDETAFSEFHTRYFDRLYQFLLIVSHGQEEEAQEALQQTFLRVVRYARVFNSEESFWCWLKAVARNVARDAGRKQQRYWGLLKRFAIRSVQVGPCSLNDLDHLLRDELDEILSELAPEDRLLLERKYIEGASVKELSSRTGLTEKAIDSRLVRLRRRLRGELLKRLNSP
jgi:RNA polymerase sigma-70 factor (ECF subfamily)